MAASGTRSHVGIGAGVDDHSPANNVVVIVSMDLTASGDGHASCTCTLTAALCGSPPAWGRCALVAGLTREAPHPCLRPSPRPAWSTWYSFYQTVHAHHAEE